jgi:hypothetical protein
MMAWDMHQDLAACFVWKEVMLWFSSLALILAEARLRVIHVASSQKLHREEAEDRRIDVTGYIGSFYHKIVIFSVLGTTCIVVF